MQKSSTNNHFEDLIKVVDSRLAELFSKLPDEAMAVAYDGIVKHLKDCRLEGSEPDPAEIEKIIIGSNTTGGAIAESPCYSIERF